MRRFLVTGGAGFIGSHLVRALAARGDHVRVVDNLVAGRWENLEGALGVIERIEADIRDERAMREASRDVDVVLHQAALGSVPRSVATPVETNAVNVGGTVTVLDAARRAGVKRVVLASSSSVYGDTPVLPKHEGMQPSPMSPYATSKLAVEQYAKVFFRTYGMDTLCLRYFNVFGPRQRPDGPYAAVIPRFAEAALAGQPLVIFGDGEQTRDFCFVDNVVDANLLAADSAETFGGDVLNIAGGRRVSIAEVARAVAQSVDGATRTENHEPRTGDVRDSLADIGKARQRLGFEPKVRWEEGLQPTVRYLKTLREEGPAVAARSV